MRKRSGSQRRHASRTRRICAHPELIARYEITSIRICEVDVSEFQFAISDPVLDVP